MLTLSLLLTSDLFRLIPNAEQTVLDERRKLCETIAVHYSLALTRNDSDFLSISLRTLVERNSEIVSAAIRSPHGRILFQSGDHVENWSPIPADTSTPTQVQVPIFKHQRRWGTVEISFKPSPYSGHTLGVRHSILSLLLYMGCCGLLAYLFFLKKTLKELDPRSVIPDRVKSAFNTLAEGLVIMDEKQHIILANSAFANKIDIPADDLLGRKLSQLNWSNSNKNSHYPWESTQVGGERSTGIALRFESKRSGLKTFMVNTIAIKDANGAVKGILATFDDLTDLEKKQVELKKMVNELQTSRAKLQEKTVELEYLATRDPLTGCLNRRAFFEKAEFLFLQANQMHNGLGCIMVDIDHFKSINDKYGHGVGDKVIQLVSGELKANARAEDLIGRYGGEEFCVIAPNTSVEETARLAEQLRLSIKNISEGRLTVAARVTASFGVASYVEAIHNPNELINRADQALYSAKESGRNRVVTWNEELSRNTSPVLVPPNPPALQLQSTPADDSTLKAASPLPAAQNNANDVQALHNTIAELKEELTYAQESLLQNEGRDEITGLPNCVLFYDRVGQALARGHRYDKIAAIIVVGIDLFQRINDALGFIIGDQLLRVTAKRLIDILRKSDSVVSFADSDAADPTVSRTGSDEFGILLTDIKDEDTITWIVKRILDNLSAPLEIDGHEIFVTCSIGVSLFPHDGDRPDILLHRANTARFSAAQRLGTNNYAFYCADLNQASYKSIWCESQLHHALENDEFSLHYQPKYDLRSNKITSFEALIRWHNPKLGSVPPMEFIPIAERTGMIHAISEWVIKTACAEAKSWVDAGFSDVGIAVNLSTVQFLQCGLDKDIIQTIIDSELDPRLLEVEITETVLMENYDIAIQVLNNLNAAGTKLAVDDFGTGYSSLAYLKHLPLNTLKIDRSFLSGAIPDRHDELIITAIIAMAHSMDITVVAEGVENTTQKSILTTLGCDEIQGYLISKPIPNTEVLPLLYQHNNTDTTFTIDNKSVSTQN